MRSFQVLEHRADVRLALSADSLEELFQAGLAGLSEVLLPGHCAERDRLDALPVREAFTIESPDATALLVDFLSEVLTLSQIRRALYCRAELRLGEPGPDGRLGLAVRLCGVAVGGFDEDVKAVTYHEAQVTRDAAGRFATRLVLDT